MANEIAVDYPTGATLYAQVRNSVGQIWNTALSAFQTYATATVTDYDIALTEQGTSSGFYTGTFPAGVTTAGVYNVVAKLRAGGSPAEGDTTVAEGSIEWDGAAVAGAGSANVEAIHGTALTGDGTTLTPWGPA